MTLDDFPLAELARIESTTQEVGRYLFDHLSDADPSMFQRRWWDDRILAWAMQDESVKVQMFRFIDVLPMLRTGDAVTRHLHEYFHDVRQHLPGAVRFALSAAPPRSIGGRALAVAARRNASGHARRFIAGTNANEVLAAAMRLRKQRQCFTLDVLGEAVISETEADRYHRQYLDLITGTAPTVNGWPEIPQIDRGMLDDLPRVNISIKLSALDSQFDPIDPAGALARVGPRLRELLRTARQHRAFINVDMESYKTKDLTLWIFKQVLMEEEFRDVGDVGIVIQAYLVDSPRDLVRLRDWARQRGKPVWVRLVKGAYWDYETVHARQFGWPVPVFQQKWQTDANYELLTRFLFRSHADLRPALGSHNIRSLAHGIATARQLGLPPTAYEIQMLYGMGDAEKDTLTGLGHRVRIYMPYGELIPGMAYLVRRLLENTSNDSFLKASFTEHVPPEKLLMNPHDAESSAPGKRPHPAPRREATLTQETFENEPWADFAHEEYRLAMEQALAEVSGQLGGHYPLRIGGVSVDSGECITSLNPSHKGQVVGTAASATLEDVEQAVTAAQAAFPAWAATPVEKRAHYLTAAAQAMRLRRFELAAWQVHECGKPWREADADVAEAIDFLDFYARGAQTMWRERGRHVPGEENRFTYSPRGVAAVIAPWNFPLAILTGMTSAALVTGNPVIMKPAEQSPVIAAQLMDIFEDLDLPPGVLTYLPGVGETVGAALVEHPQVALIAFTGSRQVGLAINSVAAAVSASGKARFVKRVISEMGGKNAVIVDSDADLDEAVAAVAHSAFGYAGQKCSACSRAVVLEEVYDAFVERLVEAARSLPVGPAELAGTVVGPVIDAASQQRVRQYVDIGRQEGREVLSVDVGELADEGYFVGPHIFADIAPDARLAQEEIFGPVLAVIRAADLDEAIRIVNGTDYALTGGLFSRSPANLQRVQNELQVGNLYLNRGITGAMVSRQPFGGFRMSGIGSQAGGPDYLLQFVVPRTITENTMRRGFAPEIE